MQSILFETFPRQLTYIKLIAAYFSLAGPGDADENRFPDNLSWAEWQRSGNDSGSLWQDPMFEDPAGHRYVLRDESPAWELGIQQIDVDNIGIVEQGMYQ